MLSLSIYQAYICFAAGLCVADLIRRSMNADEGSKQIWKRAFLYLGMLLVGLVFYYISIKIMLAFFWPTLASYQGVSDMFYGGGAAVFQAIISGVKRAYTSFFTVPFVWEEARRFRQILYGMILLVSTVCMAVTIYEKRLYKNRKMILLIILLIIFPMAAFSVYMMGSTSVSTLMLYGTVTPLLLFVGMVGKKETAVAYSMWGRKVWLMGRRMVYCGVIALCCQYYLVANEAYNRQYFTYEQTYGYMNRVSYAIQSCEGYTSDMPVMLLGTVDKEITMPQFQKLDHISGIFGESALINGYSREEFIRRYCGLPIVKASEEARETIMNTVEYRKMPVYPAEGAVQIVDGYLVVKFSED